VKWELITLLFLAGLRPAEILHLLSGFVLDWKCGLTGGISEGSKGNVRFRK